MNLRCVLLVLASAFGLLTSPIAFAQGSAPGDRNFKETLRQATNLFAKMEYRKALEKFEPLSQMAPQNKHVWIKKGYCEVYTEKPTEAVASFDRALAIDGNNFGALNGKGLALYSLRRFDEAAEVLSRAAKLRPRHRDVGLLLASALYYSGKINKSLAQYDAVLKRNPRDAGAWSMKAVALFRAGRFEEALKAFDSAIEINPNENESWISKGSCLVKLGRDDEALAVYDRAAKMNPLSPDLQYNRGLLFQKLERWEEARTALRRAVALRPEFPAAQAALDALPPPSEPRSR